MLSDLDNGMSKYDSAVLYAGESVTENLVEEYVGILLENNQGLKAEEILKKVVNYTDESWVHILLVETYYLLGDSDKVDYYLAGLEEVSLSEEESKDYLYWSITVSIENDDTSEIESALEELFAIDRYNPKYYYLLAKRDFANGESDRAKSNLEKSLEYDLEYEITDSALKLLSRVE